MVAVHLPCQTCKFLLVQKIWSNSGGSSVNISSFEFPCKKVCLTSNCCNYQPSLETIILAPSSFLQQEQKSLDNLPHRFDYIFCNQPSFVSFQGPFSLVLQAKHPFTCHFFFRYVSRQSPMSHSSLGQSCPLL